MLSCTRSVSHLPVRGEERCDLRAAVDAPVVLPVLAPAVAAVLPLAGDAVAERPRGLAAPASPLRLDERLLVLALDGQEADHPAAVVVGSEHELPRVRPERRLARGVLLPLQNPSAHRRARDLVVVDHLVQLLSVRTFRT